MADTAAAPAAPAPSAGAPAFAPAPAADAAQKQHHSATQPREQGQFSGPPGAKPTAAAPAPQFLELDEKTRIPLEEAKAALLNKQLEHGLSTAERRELQRLKELEARYQDPYKALTPEQLDAIAQQRVREFLQAEEEKKLPPEQQAFLRERRALEAEKQRLQQEKEEQRRAAMSAQEAQDRQKVMANVGATMRLLGAPEGWDKQAPSVLLREVAHEWATVSASLEARGLDPHSVKPEAIAYRVRQRLEATSLENAARLPVKRLLSNPSLLKALNELDDDEALALLAPLGERLRTRNLQARGIAPSAAQPPPAASNVVQLRPGQEPRTTQEWQAHFRQHGAPAPENAKAHATYWDMKSRGLL